MARILIVDDEALIRNALGRILKASGHECSFAASAADAMAELGRGPYELMLCDIHMPGESGTELARRVLKQEQDLAVVMVTAVDDVDLAEVILDMGAYGYLLKPAGRNETRIAVSNALRRRDLEIRHKAYEKHLEEAVEKRTWELRLSREETIQRLARAAEFRDIETAEHNQRMSHYCGLIANRLGMSAETCELLRLASVMHDVGKVGVSDLVLFKPGKLTDEEFLQIKSHPDIGYRILSGSTSELLELGAVVAIAHHEKWDGTGYPRRLAGESIPIEGRIAAVADVFDALTSDRVYRKAWSVDKTLELLVRDRGSHFDPQVVDLFLDSMDAVLEIRARHADTPDTDDHPAA